MFRDPPLAHRLHHLSRKKNRKKQNKLLKIEKIRYVTRKTEIKKREVDIKRRRKMKVFVGKKEIWISYNFFLKTLRCRTVLYSSRLKHVFAPILLLSLTTFLLSDLALPLFRNLSSKSHSLLDFISIQSRTKTLFNTAYSISHLQSGSHILTFNLQ